MTKIVIHYQEFWLANKQSCSKQQKPIEGCPLVTSKVKEGYTMDVYSVHSKSVSVIYIFPALLATVHFFIFFYWLLSHNI